MEGRKLYYFYAVILSMIVAGFGVFSHTETSGLDETSLLGVLDRIEDGHQAVILIEALEKEWIVPMHQLPPGSKVNMWFDMKLNGKKPEVLRINYGVTKRALEKGREGQRKLRELQDPAPLPIE